MNPVVRPPRGIKESGGLEVRLGPGQPIRVDPRAPTGQELLPLLVGQGEVPSEGIQGLLVLRSLPSSRCRRRGSMRDWKSGIAIALPVER